jgi:phospholipase C
MIASPDKPPASERFVKPDGLVDGHPGSSKLDLFEAMLQKILDALNGDSALKAKTAILITFDEGGEYYNSGFIEPLDFFGDGPRVPLVAVSPYSTADRSSGGNVRSLRKERSGMSA